MFKYIRNDTDFQNNISIGTALKREFRELLQDIRLGYKYGGGMSKLRLPYWMFRYFLGKVFNPLNSNQIIKLTLRINGKRTKIAIRKNQSDLFTLKEIFLKSIYSFPLDKVRNNIKTVIDLGANAGFTSVYFQMCFEDARIICVEPIRENVELIKQNSILTNGNWGIEEAAISDENVGISFYPSEWWSSGTAVESIVQSRRSKKHRVENKMPLPERVVQGITISQLIKTYNVSTIDILKIDIEGEEIKIINGIDEWIDKVNMIIIEIHDKYIDGEKVRNAFLKYGFIKLETQGECEVYLRNFN
ncbi:FkbM family methyltransferase [Bacillus thuringiensis]|uniref:FkbM family methyltransferase n=1 Tax=Bacillus thuringiensis TaxID=1428 RepID=UPI00333B5707